jgi:ribonuclease HII
VTAKASACSAAAIVRGLSPAALGPQLAASRVKDDKAARSERFMDSNIGDPQRFAKPLADRLVIGVDEAGRGPLAGPVVAAACVLGLNAPLGLDDSKKLSAKRRAVFEPLIQSSCHWALGQVEADEIDRINIFAATMLAMTRAVAALVATLGREPDAVLIDGNMTPQGRVPDWRWAARAIVGGDASEPCISAASILAKEHRDRIMRAAALDHPHYGWERNMGYGTAEHLAALREHGACPLHRRSFAPVTQTFLPFRGGGPL